MPGKWATARARKLNHRMWMGSEICHANLDDVAAAIEAAFLDGAKAMQAAAAASLLSPARRQQYVMAGPRCLVVAAEEIAKLDPATLLREEP
jgi:hypothetical protein